MPDDMALVFFGAEKKTLIFFEIRPFISVTVFLILTEALLNRLNRGRLEAQYKIKLEAFRL